MRHRRRRIGSFISATAGPHERGASCFAVTDKQPGPGSAISARLRSGTRRRRRRPAGTPALPRQGQLLATGAGQRRSAIRDAAWPVLSIRGGSDGSSSPSSASPLAGNGRSGTGVDTCSASASPESSPQRLRGSPRSLVRQPRGRVQRSDLLGGDCERSAGSAKLPLALRKLSRSLRMFRCDCEGFALAAKAFAGSAKVSLALRKFRRSRERFRGLCECSAGTAKGFAVCANVPQPQRKLSRSVRMLRGKIGNLRQRAAIQRSTSSAVRGRPSVKRRAPVSVTSTSSSMRTPKPRSGR
jgi:hypothetical protein